MKPILRASRILALAMAASGLSTLATAQQPSPLAPAVSLDESFVALQERDGETWGFGARYKVLFQEGGIVFYGMFGREEPISRWLRFELTSIGRERGESQPVASPKRHVTTDRRVDYERDACTEYYDVRADGLKQSFQFDALPAGEGDLIVRGTLDCNAPLTMATSRRIAFATEYGELFVAEVVGFDAEGRRTKGTLAYENGVLEMRLPSAFVEAAALPLTLDPLLGSSVLVSSSDDDRPSLAYDETHDVFLAVWQRNVSSVDGDIRAQRIDRNANLVGSGLAIASGTANQTNPTVSNLNYRNRFIILWEDGALDGCTVDAATGSFTTAQQLFSGEGAQVGGNPNATSTYGTFVPVVSTLVAGNQGFTFGGFLSVSSSGSISILTNQMTISSTNPVPQNVGYAAVSDVNPLGLTWFAWSTQTSTTSWGEGVNEIGGTLRYSDLSDPLNGGNPILLSRIYSNPHNSRNTRIANSGDEWVFVYRTAERRNGTDAADEIHGTHVRYLPTHGLITFDEGISVLAVPSVNLLPGDVSWNGDSILMTYGQDRGDGTFSGWATLLSVPHLDVCDTPVEIASGADVKGNGVATIYSGEGVEASGSNETSMILYSVDGSPPAVLAQRYRHDDGNIVNLGGGCGNTGAPEYRIQAQCAIVGNANHRTILDNADANQSAWLVLAFDQLGINCGSGRCTLVPDPFRAFVVATSTNSEGFAEVLLPIPNDSALAGLTLYEQWVIDISSPACSFLLGNLSDSLSVTIQ
ncbi:MAG: hypothetical protein H6834_14555 [Planctomycetes bacterium]|nr:hypothetical protein [Planctomycetota bacterium]